MSKIYRIALCDDELHELDNTEALLNTYQTIHPEHHFTVHRFTAVDDILAVTERSEGFDLLLLDVYFPNKTGIDAARELRGRGSSIPIIFLTSSLEHAVDAFDVDAVQYMIKPIVQARFFAILDRFFQHRDEDARRYIALRSDGELRRIALRDIIYCESHGNYQYITTLDGSRHRTRMALAELHMLMGNSSYFVRVGIAYLINLVHVDSMSAKEILLDNGMTVGIPRGAYPSLKEQYFQFYCDRKDG